MVDDLTEQLTQYGATPGQILDLGAEGPRTLRYLDLLRGPDGDRPAMVLESQGQPRAYVFDDRRTSISTLVPWVRRIAFRGDADFIAVVRPGRLDVYQTVLGAARVPQPLANLPEGRLRIPTLLHTPPPGEAASVRTALRTLLRASIQEAKKLGRSAGVDAHDALSLVGRSLFWRFLIDRDLLQGLQPEEFCNDARATSFAACLSGKRRALATFAWLDRTFNGGLLSFRSEGRAAEIPDAVFDKVVANIAHAATAEGQLQLALPSEWREVNFAHVPVGLLSEVYEAFAHDEDAATAKRDSIFYTPRHIAEFTVNEALASLDSIERPKVLDPAAGAGVFLVSVFRALVAREWTRTGSKPNRKTIRRILNEQLTGFDINDSALRLAELALYLTAIELDPDERPRPLSLLRFDKPLRDRSLFLREGGFARGSLAPVKAPFRGRFDLVVGNPPWSKQATTEDRDRWVDDTREIARERLGAARSESFTLPDTCPDIPLVYRALEWARPGGQIALITHGRWLFPGKARDHARQDLLESVQITGIINGASLRRPSVWPNIEAPFAIVFATNVKPPIDAAFQFVTPRLVPTAPGMSNRLHIDWGDAQLVGTQSVIETPWLLKARFRGTALDEPIVARLIDECAPLQMYLESMGTEVKNGYRVGNRRHAAGWLRGLRCITPKGVQPSEAEDGVVTFRVDCGALAICGEDRVEARRPRGTYSAPLLLIRQSPPADPNSPRAAVSEDDVAFSQSWHGASFKSVDDGLSIARYLQLLLQSSAFLYFQLLTDGGFGVERDRYVLETLQAFPVIPYDRLTGQQRQSAKKLSATLWADGWSDKLARRIDDLSFDLYGLDDIERDSVRDTLATALPYAEQRQNAAREPTRAQLEEFAGVLEAEMTNVLVASGQSARVRLRTADAAVGPWSILQVDRIVRRTRVPGHVEIPWARVLEEAEGSGATLVTACIDTVTTLVAILRHYRYWTPTRARILALSLLAGKTG